MLQQMQDGDDVREHVNKFFDAVDKLNEMKVDINPDQIIVPSTSTKSPKIFPISMEFCVDLRFLI